MKINVKVRKFNGKKWVWMWVWREGKISKKVCPIDHKEIPFAEIACDYLKFMLEDAMQEIVKKNLNEKEKN